MSSDIEPQAGVTIEETYRYTIDIGAQIAISWVSSEGTIRAVVPYDGRHLTAEQVRDSVGLGALRIVGANNAVEQELPLQLVSDEQGEERLKQGQEAVWQWAYQLDEPSDTILSVQGRVYDGASLNTDDPSRIRKVLFGGSEAFVSDLQLALDLWVPEPNVAFRPGARGSELRAIVQEQASDTQIFLRNLDELELARNMAALANSAGGRILIGINPPDELLGINADATSVEECLLQATLRCSPTVTMSPPILYTGEQGEHVIGIVVPPGRSGPHTVDGHLPQRRNNQTFNDTPANTRGAATSPPPIANVASLLAAGAGSDVMVIDAKGLRIEELEIGPAICGMINGASGSGLLIIRNLSVIRSWLPSLGNRGVIPQLEQRILAETSSIRPSLPTIRPELARVGEEQVAILRIRDHQATVAAYNGQAFEWTGAVLRGISLSDLFRRHLTRSGQPSQHQSGTTNVRLSYGELFWPAQPPVRQKMAALSQVENPDLASYDPQRRAMIWHNRPFYLAEGGAGYTCTLTTSLRHAFAEIGSGTTGPARHDTNPENLLNGTLQVQIDNQLLSGLSGTVISDHPLLRFAPVSRRTIIVADVNIYSNELFEQRRHTALLSFQLPDVSFGEEWHERLSDLKQICADMGFWLESSNVADGSTPLIVKGVRSTHFYDIELHLGVEDNAANLTRELHFKQYTESRQISSGTLDARVVLVGSGQGVEAEIAQLQLGLGQLMHERLRYLRAE